MKNIVVLLANGFEEIEALTVVDICRRAGLQTDMVSIDDNHMVEGAHGIPMFEEVNFQDVDMLVLPGGMPGTKNLEAHQGLMEKVDSFYNEGRHIAAICAAPSILGHRGMLKGRNACCFPGFEKDLTDARVTQNDVEISEHIITSRGMGCAIPFSLAIIATFLGKDKAKQLADDIIYHK